MAVRAAPAATAEGSAGAAESAATARFSSVSGATAAMAVTASARVKAAPAELRDCSASVGRPDSPAEHHPGKYRKPPTRAGVRGLLVLLAKERYRLFRISRARAAVSDGVLPTFTPAASRASF